MHSSRALAPGTVIAGDWRIECTIGEGGFGVTYEARNRRTQAHAALKEYMPAGCCSRDPRSSHVAAARGREGDIFKWGRDRFIKEAETLARLDHPSIVKVMSTFEANGTAYMALDFETGGTLRTWLDKLGRRPTEAEVDALASPLLDALREVHSLFLLHRDIKPENIVLRPDGTPVLIDFGAVRSAVANHTTTLGGVNPAATSAFAIVSDGYSPPEQYDPSGRLMGPASDIYSLGATIYTALTGDRPPSAASRHFADLLQPVSTRLSNQGFRPALLSGIDQSLAVHPRDRPQSAGEMRRALGLASTPRVGRTAQAIQPQAADAPTVVAPDSEREARHITFSELGTPAVPGTSGEAGPAAGGGLADLIHRRRWQIIFETLGLALAFTSIYLADGGNAWSFLTTLSALIGLVFLGIGTALFFREKPERPR